MEKIRYSVNNLFFTEREREKKRTKIKVSIFFRWLRIVIRKRLVFKSPNQWLLLIPSGCPAHWRHQSQINIVDLWSFSEQHWLENLKIYIERGVGGSLFGWFLLKIYDSTQDCVLNVGNIITNSLWRFMRRKKRFACVLCWTNTFVNRLKQELP